MNIIKHSHFLWNITFAEFLFEKLSQIRLHQIQPPLSHLKDANQTTIIRIRKAEEIGDLNESGMLK